MRIGKIVLGKNMRYHAASGGNGKNYYDFKVIKTKGKYVDSFGATQQDYAPSTKEDGIQLYRAFQYLNDQHIGEMFYRAVLDNTLKRNEMRLSFALMVLAVVGMVAVKLI